MTSPAVPSHVYGETESVGMPSTIWSVRPKGEALAHAEPICSVSRRKDYATDDVARLKRHERLVRQCYMYSDSVLPAALIITQYDLPLYGKE